MPQRANVRSIDAVRALSRVLVNFESQVRDAIESITLEARRGVDWFEQNRARYWPNELRKSFNEVSEARTNLTRCRSQRFGDHEPDCYEEKKALEAAIRRHHLCHQKVQKLREWKNILRHEADEFKGRLGQMNVSLDVDFPQAIAALERIVEALQRYAETGDLDEGTLAWMEAAAGEESPSIAGAASGADETSAGEAADDADGESEPENRVTLRQIERSEAVNDEDR